MPWLLVYPVLDLSPVLLLQQLVSSFGKMEVGERKRNARAAAQDKRREGKGRAGAETKSGGSSVRLTSVDAGSENDTELTRTEVSAVSTGVGRVVPGEALRIADSCWRERLELHGWVSPGCGQERERRLAEREPAEQSGIG